MKRLIDWVFKELRMPLPITATFLDEISHDIPHQNWGPDEWDADFAAMQAIGIDTVILIRCGYKQWMTYPSDVLRKHENCFEPSQDLVQLYLDLCAEYNMAFWFGTYDSGHYWHSDTPEKEVELGIKVIDEAWARYGHRPEFKGWYLSLECSRDTGGMAEMYAELGKHCKKISKGLPTMISPWIEGCKAVSASSAELSKDDDILSVEQHEAEWDQILKTISGAVDIVAFQDGHVGFDELADYLKVNKQLAEKHGMLCWTNTEVFDRDMPIKFLPIKCDKLKLKLEAAQEAGIAKAISFEFSHFMSPNSMYPSAGHLYNRYKEWLSTSG